MFCVFFKYKTKQQQQQTNKQIKQIHKIYKLINYDYDNDDDDDDDDDKHHVTAAVFHCDSLECYFSFQPVLHDWCNKGRGMYYPVCGMMHIKEPLLLIGRSSLCGHSGFPL